MHEEHLNSEGVGLQKKAPKPLTGVMVHVANMCHTSSLFDDKQTTHWLGPETLMSLKVEGYEVNALTDSGSQVNTVTPNYVCQHEFPVLPQGHLMDYPLNLVGLGGTRTMPLCFVIL